MAQASIVIGFTQSFDPDGPNYRKPPVITRKVRVCGLLTTTRTYSDGVLTDEVVSFGEPYVPQAGDEVTEIGRQFGVVTSERCRVDFTDGGCTSFLDPVLGSVGLEDELPYSKEDDAADAFVDALAAYRAEMQAIVRQCVADALQEVIAKWAKEIVSGMDMAGMFEPAKRTDGVKPALAGLTETAPDMRYRGLGFSDKGG